MLLVDKALIGVPRSKIREQLQEVGFDDDRQSEIVGGLSGGWKMKLELARAMLYNADLLLLDEVRILSLIGRSPFTDIHFLTAYQSREYSQIIQLHPNAFYCYLQLDRTSVLWLEQYLISHNNVTCLIISHDSRSVFPPSSKPVPDLLSVS